MFPIEVVMWYKINILGMPGIKLTIPRHATTKESIKKPTFVNAQNVSENQRQGCKELFNFFPTDVKAKEKKCYWK